MKPEEPLAKALPRQPGNKEIRYTHLLSGNIERHEEVHCDSPSRQTAGDQVTQLKEMIESLKDELSELRQEFMDFQKQFSKGELSG